MIHYDFRSASVTTCQNAMGLTFFLLGQPPHSGHQRPLRGIISTGGLN